MAWSHVGTTIDTASGTASATPALPSGWQADDLFVLLGVVSTADPADPTGYTRIRGTVITTQRHLVTWFRVAQAGDTSPTVNGSSRAMAILSAFRGNKSATPLDVESGQANASSTSTTAPGVTTTAANDLLVHAIGHDGSQTHTAPSGFTEPANGDGNNQATVGGAISYKFDQALGATGAVSGTLSAANENAAHLAAFFLATGSGGPLRGLLLPV